MTFSVTATYGNLTYQWQKNTVDIPDENGTTLTLKCLQPVDEGSYRVVVSNTTGSVSSNPATLTVYPDADGDGLTDNEEVNTYHTDPSKADTDARQQSIKRGGGITGEFHGTSSDSGEKTNCQHDQQPLHRGE